MRGGNAFDFESCAFDRSAISAKNLKYYTPIFSKRQVILERTVKNSYFLAFCREKRVNICKEIYIKTITKWVRFGYGCQKTLKSMLKFFDIFAVKSRFFRGFAYLRAKIEHDQAVLGACRYLAWFGYSYVPSTKIRFSGRFFLRKFESFRKSAAGHATGIPLLAC